MAKLSKRVSRLASQTTQSGLDAAVTIAARTPGLMIPTGENAREAARMVEEKVAAAFEGTFGAAMAWGSFLFASALRGGATPTQFSHALFDVAEAAAAPAHRTVRANARRLTGRSA
jgi:shikimate kinase